MKDYDGLFGLAIELRNCTTDVDCLSLTADYIFEKFPAITVVRYLHLFRTHTQFFTITADQILKCKIEGIFPEDSTAAGFLTQTQDTLYLEDVTKRDAYLDLVHMHKDYRAVCFLGVPLIPKNRFVGAVMVGSLEAGSLSPPWVKEALDFIARTIATYLYLKNVRRDLQLGKTILHQVVPETIEGVGVQVISRLLETPAGQGFIPVQQTTRGFRYASDDDSDVDPEDIIPGIPYVPPALIPPNLNPRRRNNRGPNMRRAQRLPREVPVPAAPGSDDANSDTTASDEESREDVGPSSSGVRSGLSVGGPRSNALRQSLVDEPQLPGGFGGMGLQPDEEQEEEPPESQELFENLRLGPFSNLEEFEIPLPHNVTSRLPQGLAIEGRPVGGNSRSRHRPKPYHMLPGRGPSSGKAVDTDSDDDYQSDPEYRGYYHTIGLPRYSYPPASLAETATTSDGRSEESGPGRSGGLPMRDRPPPSLEHGRTKNEADDGMRITLADQGVSPRSMREPGMLAVEQEAPFLLRNGGGPGNVTNNGQARHSNSLGLGILQGAGRSSWADLERSAGIGLGGSGWPTRSTSGTEAQTGVSIGGSTVATSNPLGGSRPFSSFEEVEGPIPLTTRGMRRGANSMPSQAAFAQDRHSHSLAGQSQPRHEGLQRLLLSEIVPLEGEEDAAVPRRPLLPRGPRVVPRSASFFSEITPLPEPPAPDPPPASSAIGSYFQWRLSLT